MNGRAAVARICAITEAARLLHRHRPGWEALLGQHVPDGADRCTRCRSAGGFAPAWPCSLHLIGRAAQRLAEPAL